MAVDVSVIPANWKIEGSPDLVLRSVTRELGTGLPVPRHILSEHGLAHGAVHARSVLRPRVFTLLTVGLGDSFEDLRDVRQAFADYLMADHAAIDLITLTYTPGAENVYIEALYDSGLEKGAWEGFSETLPIRFIAPDPIFKSEAEYNTALSPQTSLTSVNNVIMRTAATAVWAKMGTGANNTVIDALFDDSGDPWLCGAFTALNGVTCRSVGVWGGATFTEPGSGFDDGAFVLRKALNGDIWIGGVFLLDGPAAVNMRTLAQWGGASWTERSAGILDEVQAIFEGDGFMYFGGTLASASNGIYQSPSDTLVFAMSNGEYLLDAASVAGAQERVIVAGSQLNIGGNADADYIGRITDLSTGSPAADALEGPFNGQAGAILIYRGVYYMGGDFTTGAGRTLNRIAVYRGQRLEAMGSGFDTSVLRIGVFGGKIIAAGKMTTADGKTLPGAGGLAEWTGYRWVPMPLQLPSAGDVYALANDGNDNMIIGGLFSGTVITESITTVTPGGDTSTFPRIVFTGPGTLHRITNYMTGDVIYFEMPMRTGETVTLDLTRELHADVHGDQTRAITFISDRVGNAINTIIPGSNEGTFRLVPGANLIGVFIDDAAGDATIYYRRAFKTLDSLH